MPVTKWLLATFALDRMGELDSQALVVTGEVIETAPLLEVFEQFG